MVTSRSAAHITHRTPHDGMAGLSSCTASPATVGTSSSGFGRLGDADSIARGDTFGSATEFLGLEDESKKDGVENTPVDAEAVAMSRKVVQTKFRYSCEPQHLVADGKEHDDSECPDNSISTIFRLPTLPPRVDSNGIVERKSSSDSSQEGSEKALLPNSETLRASSAPTSSYSLRNRGGQQNKLVYDLKYHPMDDTLRPSQAAKRRSAHEEQLLSSDDSSECSSVRTAADTQPLSDVSFKGEVSRKKIGRKQAKQGKKRSRDRSRPPQQPTRRSSRKVSEEKKSYDMSVHPQDKELELLSSDDEEVSMSCPKRRRTAYRNGSDSNAAIPIVSKANGGRSKGTVFSSDTESMTMDQEDAFTGGNSFDEIMQMIPEQITRTSDTHVKSTSPTPSISTPPSHGIRRKESLDVWKLFPGDRYFRHDRDSWPFTPGQPFHIWSEQTEDQVAEEALAAFPLDFEHDDKENQLENSDQQNSDPLEGIAVIPASQYRRAEEDALNAQNNRLVREALYDDAELDFDTYGLRSTDGANDEDAVAQLGTHEAIMRFLASGAHLPRDTMKNTPPQSMMQ